MKSKVIGVLTLLFMTAVAYGYKYTVWQSKELPVGRLEQNEAGDFKLSLTKTEGTRNYTIAIGRTPDVKVPAQYKLAFKMRGGPTNKNTFVGMHILTDQGQGKPWVTHYGPNLPSDNRDWRLYVLSLDSDFHLSDAMWTITQVKFHLSVASSPNAEASIEVKDVRFVAAEDLGAAGATYQVEGMRCDRANAKPLVKVYFDLDNEDRAAFIVTKDRKNATEKNLYDGFAGYLLSGVDGRVHGPETACLSGLYSDISVPTKRSLIGEVDTPLEADVIVYSRAKADASRPHVYPGKKMIVFGCAADVDVKQALPVVQTYLNGHDYAERLPVKAVGTHPVLAGETLSQTSFGVYQTMQLRDGARRVLDFADGRPCVVENEQIMVVATGIGAQLLPDEFFFDRFLLRAILYMGGHTDMYATMDRLGKMVQNWRKDWLVTSVLQEAKIQEKDGWRPGGSRFNFGRFGYNTGEGLLNYAQRRDMGIENGARSFRMDIRPELATSLPKGPATLRVSRINWTNKAYQIQHGSWHYSLEVSLLSPFVRYTIPNIMDLTLENVAERAVYETAVGWQNVKLADVQELPNIASLKRPWVLLYCEGETRPLQLVFTHRPTALKPIVDDGSVMALRLELGGQQTMFCGWPFGTANISTQAWSAGLPTELSARLDRAAAMAFAFPHGCDEIFRIDRHTNRIHIIQQTLQYLPAGANDWGIQPLRYGMMPPLMGVANQEKLLVQCPEQLVNLEQPTTLGPTWAVIGSSVLRYSLPLPAVDDDIMTPGYISDDIWLKEVNDAFAGGNRWSWGGGGRYEWLTFDKPGGPRGGDNMSPFSWMFGVPSMLQGYFMYNAENRAKLRERVNHRYVEAMEQYQYKYLARHRTEPFSGLQYPVMFRSIYPFGVDYAEGVGTGYNYGDCNEAVTQFTWSGELLAERFGMASLIRANWPFYRYVARYQKVMEDWAYHAGSCREDGAGAWIDMLNGEYSGMISHARLARICGDAAEEDDALYRAAKRMVPTLLRLRFHTVLRDSADPKAPNRRFSLVTGFGEYGTKTYPNPLRVNGNVTAAMDLFDFSQGAPGSLFRLYEAYTLPEIHSYLENFAIPALTATGHFNANERYIQALAYFTTPSMKPCQWTDDIINARRKFWTQDWPGITVGYPLSLMMWRKVKAPMVTVCREAEVREMLYDVQRKRLDMNVMATAATVMELTVPQRLVINGKEQPLPSGKAVMLLPLVSGRNVVEAQY